MEADSFVQNVRYIIRYIKKYGKKPYYLYSKEEQDIFIEKTDTELVEDLVSSFDFDPDELTWDMFYPRYQKMHKEKYGEELK